MSTSPRTDNCLGQDIRDLAMELEEEVDAVTAERDELKEARENGEAITKDRRDMENLFHVMNMDLPDQDMSLKQMAETIIERVVEMYRGERDAARALCEEMRKVLSYCQHAFSSSRPQDFKIQAAPMIAKALQRKEQP